MKRLLMILLLALYSFLSFVSQAQRFVTVTNAGVAEISGVDAAKTLCRVAVAWDQLPDAVRRRFEYRSVKTTNQWVRIIPMEVEVGRAILVLDLSTTVFYRSTVISEAGNESAPSEEVRVGSMVRPAPDRSLRTMYVQPVAEHLELLSKRSRIQPSAIPPPIP